MALVIDIESSGKAWGSFDAQTQHLFSAKAKTSGHSDEEWAEANMSLSPYTAEIVALGALDTQTLKGGVYFQSRKKDIAAFEENGIKFQSCSEQDIIAKFYQLAAKYQEFVTFNGRMFDIPFLFIRSAINKIKPTKDLMRNRYLNAQAFDAKHIDLFDQLSYYGSARYPSGAGLHMACQAFGITTPKDDEIDGSKVTSYFNSGKYEEIARYNARDLFATAELYSYWKNYLN